MIIRWHYAKIVSPHRYMTAIGYFISGYCTEQFLEQPYGKLAGEKLLLELI